MKFELERDIPKFKAASPVERVALRREAEGRDPIIRWMFYVQVAMWTVLFLSAQWVLLWIAPGSGLLASVVLFVALIYPFTFLFRGFFITPRVRRALG